LGPKRAVFSPIFQTISQSTQLHEIIITLAYNKCNALFVSAVKELPTTEKALFLTKKLGEFAKGSLETAKNIEKTLTQ